MARRADVLRFAVGSSWGTGFAIAPNRALTALDVVGAVVDGQLALHADTIDVTAEVTDSDGETETTTYPACQCTIDDVVDFDRERGWIVVDLDASAFQGMVIPSLGAVLASDAEGACTSYGFPDEGSDLGAAADGVVLAIDAPDAPDGPGTAAALHLRMRDATAPGGGPAPGFLGAPIMVGRHVVGLVCRPATADGDASAGELYAIAIAELAKRLKLTIDPRARPSTPALPPSEPPVAKTKPPKVAGPLARLRSRFRSAQPQLAALGRSTELHHVLQELELPYEVLSRERRRLAVAPAAWDELREPLDALARLLARALGLIDGGAGSGDALAGLRRRLADAAHSLQAAIEGGDDPEALDAALLQVRRVLAVDVPSANHRTRGALHDLGLGDVVGPLRAALDALPRDDTSDPKLDELPPLVTSLESLHGKLEGLIRDHEAWLDIDLELGFFAGTGRQALDDAALAWPVLRTSLDAATRRASPRWSGAITAARDRLDGDLARGALPSARLVSLRALWRACHLQFVDIHHQVVRICEELARVSTTLGGVLDAVKQVDG